ncbi:EamA family transporter [Candidatus Woesearchaeota archaeon]|nr:EamA family transporter [Candidatus Woesearchaeota archaeon]
MATKQSLLYISLAIVFSSLAQVFYKFSADKLSFDAAALLTNIPLITGLALYGAGAFFFIKALQGGEVSLLYPIMASSYLWVTILSYIIFSESIGFFRWLGVSLIILGIFFVSLGSRQASRQEHKQHGEL